MTHDALAAPPPPPIPELHAPLTPAELIEALRAFGTSYYAVHPFHTRMHAGTLNRRQMQGWAANRLAYQQAIPRKDAAILANCPDASVRRRWLQRIIDHDGRPGDPPESAGIERWVRLGVALGVPREQMLDGRHVLPAVRMAAESYVTFCRTHHWVEGCASSLTELFAPDLMKQRIAAFRQHYAWVDDDGLKYFESRLTQAPRDSGHALEIVTAHCTTVLTQRAAFDALAFKLELLWVMIDAIDHGCA